MFYDSNHAQIISPDTDRPRLGQWPAARHRARPAASLFLGRLMPIAAPGAARRRLLGGLLACACALGSLNCAAQAHANGASAALERSVKAAFLYKFLGYTEFPPASFADAGAPLVIGVVGADELAAELARIVTGRTVLGRAVQVKTFKDGEAPGGVHLLFIGGSDSARVRAVLKAATATPMLVVTETDNGLPAGSVINFKIVEERVRFDVSLDAADRNSVKLSSRLLTVANHVLKGTP